MGEGTQTLLIDTRLVQNLVYTIRGQLVMLDRDLADIYGYDVKRLNEQVKRNIGRFPDDFMFQLTMEEIPECLKSQFATLNESGNKRGLHIKKLPYVFTEQGIYMLATVLRGELAEKQSIYIMRAFREMRRFISSNHLLFERIRDVELKQLEYQKRSDEKFDHIFEYISDHEESIQKIFYGGQIFDAFNLLTNIISQASRNIILIDGYVDVNTLNILTKKKEGAKVTIYTLPSTKITKRDIELFNEQYSGLTIMYTRDFHDRFLILDESIGYHIGASLKDAGKRCFGINKMEDKQMIEDLLYRIRGNR